MIRIKSIRLLPSDAAVQEGSKTQPVLGRFGFCVFTFAPTDLVTSPKSWNRLVSKAREINAISSTSTRRGPRSISETKVSLLRSCSAAPVWVRLARRRVRSARQLDQVVG